MNVLVIGGLGHVGSSLVLTLKNQGYNVTILDDLSSNAVQQICGVKLIKKSAAKIFEVPGSFEYVFHLGEFARVEQSVDMIEQCFSNNRENFWKVVNYCVKKKSKLIYSGSSTINADNGKNRFESPYAFTKYQNVELLKNYGKWRNLDFAIAYFSNVYGGNESANPIMGTVIAKFLDAYKRGRVVVDITHPGTQCRNFTHIEDTVSALMLIMKNGTGDGYFIASDESHTIIEVAEKLGLNYRITAPKQGNRMMNNIVTDKVKGLGWKAKWKLDQYLADKVKENS